MGFTALDTSSLDVGKRITSELLINIKNDLDYLYGELSGQITYNGLISNGSMEFDVDLDGRPDNWDITLFTGGGATLVTTATTWASPTHGSKTLCISKPAGVGNGGALVLSDYFGVSSVSILNIGMMLYSNTSSAINKVTLYTYDKDKTYSTSIDLYNSQSVGFTTAYESTLVGNDLRMVAVLSDGRGGTDPRWARLGITAGATEGDSSCKTFIDNVYVNDNTLPYINYVSTVYSWPETRLTITSGSTGGITFGPTTIAPSFTIPRIYGNTTKLLEVSMKINCGLSQTGTTGGASIPNWTIDAAIQNGLSSLSTIHGEYNSIMDNTSRLSTGTAKKIIGHIIAAPAVTSIGNHAIDVVIKAIRPYEDHGFFDPAENWGATFISEKSNNKISVRVVDPDM